MAEDLSRPAFRYPSSGRRPERLNQSREVNAPLQLLRGWAAGTLGLPGDIEGLVRMLPGIKNETPVLPTSDFYREYLPGYDERPAARAISGLGALTGGMGATRVAREGLGAVKRATDVNAIRDYVRSAQGLSGMPGTAVIKPKGGNWISGAGSPEASVERLKVRPREPAVPMNAEELQRYRDLGYGPYDPETGLMPAPVNADTAALNKWIDQKLARYVRNEMGTPEDPIRALAEEGTLHFTPENVFLPSDTAAARTAAGYPRHGMSKSQLATDWEVLADAPISVELAGDLKLLNERNPTVRENPWLAKVPPETTVYSLYPGSTARNENLGFPHLIDELRNAVNPESGLPRELLWKYSDLDKVTVPQAVERVAKINEWRAAQMEAARKAAREGIPLHKEYEGGYQWMAAPDTAANPKSLQYIKDVGCESGWCTQGEGLAKKYGGGGNKLYVLHDPKGKSVVQISVRPGRPWNQRSGIFYEHPELESPWAEFSKEVNAAARAKGVDRDRNYIVGFPDWLAKNQPDVFAKYQTIFEEPPADIVEIKGKLNAAPKDEHLPFVQDFVRSGQWGRVGDIENTGLIDARVAGRPMPGRPAFMTDDEFKAYQAELERGAEPREGFARGGAVTATPEYDPLAIDALADELLSAA